MKRKVHIEVTSSLGQRITTTVDYWNKIIKTKHPTMEGRERLVEQALKNPEQVRRSRKDPKVYLYYKGHESRYCCVVAKHLNGEGFIVTAYITDRIKAGDKI